MKKIFLFAAATAVALSSCSKSEVITSSLDNQAIGFTNYVGNSTKGSNVNAASLNAIDQTMGVFAYLHVAGATTAKTGEANFMDNEVVTATSYGTWGYTNTKYWPTSTDEIDFFAYAPYAAAQTQGTTNDSYPVVTFTQDDDLAKMVDYVYATKDNLISTSNNGKVTFAFNHALSRISFSAKTTADYTGGDGDAKTNGTYLYVTDIVAKVAVADAVNSKFDLEFSNSGSSDDNYASLATTSIASVPAFHATTASWTIFDKVAETTEGTPTIGVELSTTPINFTTLKDANGSSVLSDASESDGVVTDADANKYIFLVPQTIASGDIKVYITYYTETYTSAGVCSTSSSVTRDVNLPATTFKQGYAYNFPISVGLDAIVFDTVDVSEDWSTGVVGDVYTPAQTYESVSITAESQLQEALEVLNTAAGANALATTFYVDASDVDLTADQTITLASSNFAVDDVIEFTFNSNSSSKTISIESTSPGSSSYTFVTTNSGTDSTITFTVTSAE